MIYKYTLDTFLSKPLNGDKRLIINDKNGNFVDSIITDLSHYFVKNNCLVIKITNTNDLILSFESRSVAQQALEKLDLYKKELMEHKKITYWVSDTSGGDTTTPVNFLDGIAR
jgi:hypothetical protein